MSGEAGGTGGGWSSAMEGAGLIGGLTAFYQPFISQNWARGASNRDWKHQLYLMRNRYQMATRDLRKAGLNPMLAYTQGGVSGNAPSGNYAAYDADVAGGISKGVSTAMALKSAKDNLALLAATKRGAEADAVRKDYEANAARYAEPTAMAHLLNIVQERDRVNAETERIRATRENVDADTSFTRVRERAARMGIPYSAEQMDWYRTSPLGRFEQNVAGKKAELRRAVGRFVSGAKSVKDVLGKAERERGSEYE